MQALSNRADAAFLKKRPLPEAPTGYYDWQVKDDPLSDGREGRSRVSHLINRVKTFKARGGYKLKLSDINAIRESARHPAEVDDRKGAFAAGLHVLGLLDIKGDRAQAMNDGIVDKLYNTIPHPPASYLGPKESFRSADGGGNNLENHNLGRAGTHYARSVQGKAGLPRSSLPDAGLVFDAILKRKGTQKHAGGMSALIFAFATIVTHTLFRTDHHNIHINNASSYLDLSPIYGDNQAIQDTVRDKASGRGLLYPDTFAEERLLFLPPATSALLVLFSRNHNYIARRLLKINERKRWSDPVPTDAQKLALQDEEIFQTARLVNCGHFMSAVRGDYVASFLGSSEGTSSEIDPFKEIDNKDLKVPRGLGNHVSVEFNVLYRWHAAMSEQDEEWTKQTFKTIFKDKSFEELTFKDLGVVSKMFAEINANPRERTFAGLKRGPDGKFNDDDLARILHNATEDPAGAFRGRGTPAVLRIVEIMGIEQARAWGVCTMNEFRKFLHLKEFKTFEDWNPDPEIAGAARKLYGHIDNLELYTGLQAEATMPLTNSFRFACGYTITRGVLGDAFALVRGDRFFTSDLTPSNLTTWGFYDCQREMNNGAEGGIIPRLLVRNLPRHFPWNSTYTLFPFFTPEKMKGTLARRKLDKKYTFDRPQAAPSPRILNTFTSLKTILNNPSQFQAIGKDHNYGLSFGFDEFVKQGEDMDIVMNALFPSPKCLEVHAQWLGEMVNKKIKERAFEYPNSAGNYVDIVDVISATCAHVVADKLTGIKLKTKENPSGMFTENEFFDMLKTLYIAAFLAFDELKSGFVLHEAAIQARTIVGGLMKKSLLKVSPSLSPNFFAKFIAFCGSCLHPPTNKPSYTFLEALSDAGRPIDELVGNILAVVVGVFVNTAHAAVNVIDFYLDDARADERRTIIELLKTSGPKSDVFIREYVCEAMRLKPSICGLWREAAVDMTISQGSDLPPVDVKAGDRIWASFRNANLDPLDFPQPTEVNPARPFSSYSLNSADFGNCLGTAYTQLTIVEIVKAVFSLKNVRRATGNIGKLHGFSESVHETETDFYVQRNGKISACPGSMHIVFDD